MKDIKEVKQALETLKDYNEHDSLQYIDYTKWLDILDQFITETEELIKENEELKNRLNRTLDLSNKEDKDIYITRLEDSVREKQKLLDLTDKALEFACHNDPLVRDPQVLKNTYLEKVKGSEKE